MGRQERERNSQECRPHKHSVNYLKRGRSKILPLKDITMKKRIKEFLDSFVDLYGDAYLTKNNLRYAIRENIQILFDCLDNGDFLYETDDGFLLITGFSDNAPRKYVKILTENLETAEALLNQAKDIPEELWIKLNQRNPLVQVCLKCGFKNYGNRGKEILLVRINKE